MTYQHWHQGISCHDTDVVCQEHSGLLRSTRWWHPTPYFSNIFFRKIFMHEVHHIFKYRFHYKCCVCKISVYFHTRPTLERRKTLGRLRSINRNIHFANQSQTCQLFENLKKKFSNISWKGTVKSGAINPRLNWYRKSRSIIKSIIYIYIYITHFNDLSQVCKSKFIGWATIEELSISRRLRTFLISWGQKTRVKHCYVDLSSWYELSFAICIDMDVILDVSTTIQQF